MMTGVLAKLLYGLVFCEALAGLALGLLAYSVRSFDKDTGTWSDGLGRKLETAPLVARFIFGTDSLWAGWGYFVAEYVALWGGIGVAITLLHVAAKLKQRDAASTTGIPRIPPLQTTTTTTVDPATVKLGPIRHAELPRALIERAKALEPVFADVYPVTHEKWLEGFRRDVHPEREIAIWEQIAVAFTQFTAGRSVSLEIRREAFALLLFRSGATADATLKHAKLKYLTKDLAEQLVELYTAPPRPISLRKG